MPSTWEDPPEYRGGGGGVQLAMPSLTPGVRRILIATGVVFALQVLLYVTSPEAGAGLMRWGGITPGLWADRPWLPPFWQLFTWGFLHSVVDPFHILKNMLFLYFLGTMLEGIVGTRRFLVAYFTSLLFSGVCTLVVGLLTLPTPDPELGGLLAGLDPRYRPTIGASGAVFAIVVAMAVLRPTMRVIFILFPLTLRTLAILFVAIELYSELIGSSANVAHLAHLSGAAWGFLLVKRNWIWRDPVADLEGWRQRQGERRQAEDELQLDELLEKINRHGIHSLSSRERAFLKRVSKRR